VAVVEMAAASGLALVPPGRRDPLRTTTFGTGQLILAALDAGAREIIVGIGGSATCDGGCGCAQAMGVLFLEDSGRPCVCGLAGGGLKDIARIDPSDRDPRLAEATVRIACDVVNPLIGPQGAAAVYAPQKGADAAAVAELEAGLTHLATVIQRDLGVAVADLPGAGAAGGLGGGLIAFADGRMESGATLVAEAAGLGRRLAGADVCLTGEGKLDAQSASGKTAVGVARLARRRGVPTLCVAGQVTEAAPRGDFDVVRSLTADEVPPRAAMRQAPVLLRYRAAEAIRQFLDAGGGG
jgi:glycerate kinase